VTLALLVTGGLTAALLYEVVFHLWPAAPAAVAGGIFLYFLLLAPRTISESRKVRIIPYFDRRTGGPETFTSGHALARNALDLDDLAAWLGLAPLGSFGFADDLCGERVVWHDPASGLRTVSGLLAELRREPGLMEAEVLADLEKIEARLQVAVKEGALFCLLLRHGSTWSGQELSVRRGFF
jgi:hypothetical protein